MEVLHVRREDMKEYKKAGLHHAELYRDSKKVEWRVYKGMVRRARGQEDRARWDRRMRKMWNEWVALCGKERRKPRRRRGAMLQQERVVLDRGERDKGQTGHTVVCAAGTQSAEGKGAECDRAVDMFRRDNIAEGTGQAD